MSISREFYPEKNLFEAKAKKDYGNKAYQASNNPSTFQQKKNIFKNSVQTFFNLPFIQRLSKKEDAKFLFSEIVIYIMHADFFS